MEKIEIKLPVNPETGEVMDEEAFYDAALEAGWSEDPGTGKAVLVPDEAGRGTSEILNPRACYAPMGFSEDSLEDMIRRHFERVKALEGMDEVDSAEEADDFEIDDDLPDLRSIYEVVDLVPEAPALRGEAKERVETAGNAVDDKPS